MQSRRIDLYTAGAGEIFQGKRELVRMKFPWFQHLCQEEYNSVLRKLVNARDVNIALSPEPLEHSVSILGSGVIATIYCFQEGKHLLFRPALEGQDGLVLPPLPVLVDGTHRTSGLDTGGRNTTMIRTTGELHRETQPAKLLPVNHL